MLDYKKDFVQFALDSGVLKFGEFQLKSGRISPFFFNTGLFNTGNQLANLGVYYARALIDSGITADILYGPAYKGIPLVSSTAIAYAQLNQKDIPFAFNRKEAKEHGEGGGLIGAPLQGDVVILDDVITAGTSIRESVDIINQAGARACAVLIALDRQEKGRNQQSAVQEVSQLFNLPVVSIINFTDIIGFLERDNVAQDKLAAVIAYQQQYGI